MADQKKKDLVLALIDMIELEQSIVVQDRGAWEKILMDAPDSVLLASNTYGGPDTKRIMSYVKGKLGII
jgi:hypothetical protein